jgi:hypothetical protein
MAKEPKQDKKKDAHELALESAANKVADECAGLVLVWADWAFAYRLRLQDESSAATKPLGFATKPIGDKIIMMGRVFDHGDGLLVICPVAYREEHEARRAREARANRLRWYEFWDGEFSKAGNAPDADYATERAAVYDLLIEWSRDSKFDAPCPASSTAPPMENSV